jgi:hypothetical protein
MPKKLEIENFLMALIWTAIDHSGYCPLGTTDCIFLLVLVLPMTILDNTPNPVTKGVWTHGQPLQYIH